MIKNWFILFDMLYRQHNKNSKTNCHRITPRKANVNTFNHYWWPLKYNDEKCQCTYTSQKSWNRIYPIFVTIYFALVWFDFVFRVHCVAIREFQFSLLSLLSLWEKENAIETMKDISSPIIAWYISTQWRIYDMCSFYLESNKSY